MNPEDLSIETVRGWLSTGILGAILLVLARLGKPVVDFLLETRKLKMLEKKEDRQGFGELIEVLTEQVKALTNQVSSLSAENGQLRNEVRSLHSILDGMRRSTLQESMSAQRAVVSAIGEDRLTPNLREALTELDRVTPIRPDMPKPDGDA